MRRQRKRAPKWKEGRREGEGPGPPPRPSPPSSLTWMPLLGQAHGATPASGMNSDVLPATVHHRLQAQGRRSKPPLG